MTGKSVFYGFCSSLGYLSRWRWLPTCNSSFFPAARERTSGHSCTRVLSSFSLHGSVLGSNGSLFLRGEAGSCQPRLHPFS